MKLILIIFQKPFILVQELRVVTDFLWLHIFSNIKILLSINSL